MGLQAFCFLIGVSVPCWLLFPGNCFRFPGVVCTLPVFFVPCCRVFSAPSMAWNVPCLGFSVPVGALCFPGKKCVPAMYGHGCRCGNCFSFRGFLGSMHARKRERENERERERERYKNKNYFASSDPHHGIQFIPSDILSGKSSSIPFDILFEILSGISIWHSICHIFWHSIWQIFWHSIWQWHIFWHSIWHIFGHSIWHIFGHSIWNIYLEFYLADLLTFYLANLVTFYLAFYLEYLLTFYMALFLAVEVSGEAHSAQTLAGWSPARPTTLRLSPFEVQRGPLRSRASRWCPATTTAIKSWQMRSGDDHCQTELEDEVRRRSLRSRAGRGGPARRRRSKRRRRRRSRASDINLTTLTWQVGNKTRKNKETNKRTQK